MKNALAFAAAALLLGACATTPAAPPAAPPVRDVEAGPIWDQADAEKKCPVVAAAVGGTWTGHWVTTRPSEMSVCNISAAKRPAGPLPAPQNIEAGPIWNQEDAAFKCPVAAAAAGGKWNGQWVTTRQGEMSVCGVAPN